MHSPHIMHSDQSTNMIYQNSQKLIAVCLYSELNMSRKLYLWAREWPCLFTAHDGLGLNLRFETNYTRVHGYQPHFV